jgi:tetratricopeptide (TPR) repeat protein
MRSALGCLMPLALLVGLAGASFAQSTLLEQGRAANVRSEPDTAIAILERAAAQAPEDAEVHYQLAIAHGSKAQASGLVGKLRHALRAKRELETAIALDPRHVEARMLLLQAYLAAPGLMGGSEAKAFEQAKEITAVDPVIGHRAYAIVYTHAKKGDLAKKELLDGIREYPESPKARSYYGQYLANVEQDYAGAFTVFEAALEINPGYMPAYYHIGRVAALADSNLALGEESLERYLGHSPKQNEPGLAWAHYYLGYVYEREGNATEAKDNYEAAIALDRGLKEAARSLKRMKG